MNKTSLKRYAPQARRDFIQAVTTRSQLLGIRLNLGRVEAEPCEVRGDVAMIGGRAWPASVGGLREALVDRMRREGYSATLEAIAYTWFNRLAALRYMELHDYLGHGRRVLSNPEGGPPEVLAHAMELAESGELPGLRAELVRELKLANQDGELYRRVLVAQCNALHAAMPFLFEAIDDETELLLPDNLLHSDSVVAKLVGEIAEEDWAEVEVIGWLYQFFISEKKDEVIGKVVKSEDIPAATQLFTPNWIVQYLVQNSVGRLWLMANPSSGLAAEWPYYIAPAEQTPEVQAQLDALIQTRIAEDGDTLNPESLTVLDPACGSGHILVVAYDVLKAIYLERGYRLRDVPRLILEKNLYGLDIDGRAAQLAGFALLMKARADDRKLFSGEPPKLNVIALQESKGLDLEELATHLQPFGIERGALRSLIQTFEHAKTFGSLIQIPQALNDRLAGMTQGLRQALQDGDLYAREAAKDTLPLVWQALLLGMKFDAVLANPPYMGRRGMNPLMREFIRQNYENCVWDVFAAFIERTPTLTKIGGGTALVTMQSWMFLSSFEEMRLSFLTSQTLDSMIHLGSGAFGSISGDVVQTTAFATINTKTNSYRPSFFRLIDGDERSKNDSLVQRKNSYRSLLQKEFLHIPAAPIAYWLSPAFVKAFSSGNPLRDHCLSESLNITGDNNRFIRYWWEVSYKSVGRGNKWLPYAKGGSFRRWYGNIDYTINWSAEALEHYRSNNVARLIPEHLWYRPGITWSKVTSGTPGFRLLPPNSTYDVGGSSVVVDDPDDRSYIMAFLNSKVGERLIRALNTTVNIQVGNILDLPLIITSPECKKISNNTSNLISIFRSDWDLFEASLEFKHSPWIKFAPNTLSNTFQINKLNSDNKIQEAKKLEEANNIFFIKTYGLDAEVTSEIPEDQITLARADREEDCQRLVSYAIGCMMGRYSLDEPGLIYAHAGNEGFDPTRYTKFPADADGILPLTDTHWFPDDTAARVREFVRAVWGPDTLEENLAWLAESLGQKTGETPDETLRRYLADKFFKDHLQTYKKRPIYWLFSSGKQGAFQCLVYLHRYHAGTLARLRADYVLPLTGKMAARLDSLEADIRAASSTAARTRLTKQRDALRKQQHELLAYDEKLRHYADQRITLDLDDGVKVNYGKFGDLLAEVKAVTGGTGDD